MAWRRIRQRVSVLKMISSFFKETDDGNSRLSPVIISQLCGCSVLNGVAYVAKKMSSRH